MFEVVAQMGALILCGVAWRIIKPGGMEPVQLRKALTDFVYFLLLPALVISVLWQAELGTRSFAIAFLAASAVLLGAGLAWLSCRWWCGLSKPAAGAAILAAAFPNATYMGLPVLETTMGPWARSIAIQYDLFACTPLLFTLGIYIATRYGTQTAEKYSSWSLLKIPAIWAAVLGVILNLTGLPIPKVVDGFLNMLNKGVVPLMLFSLGLSLQWSKDNWNTLPSVIPIALIQLVIMPLFTYLLLIGNSMPAEVQAAIILETAMPSMVIGLVICARFGLDTNLYATAVTFSTALSMLTLPLWMMVLA